MLIWYFGSFPENQLTFSHEMFFIQIILPIHCWRKKGITGYETHVTKSLIHFFVIKFCSTGRLYPKLIFNLFYLMAYILRADRKKYALYK